MKKAGIFYLIIMMLLSVIPCSDEVETASAAVNISQNIAHNNQQGNAESCSPICLCMCCGQSVVAPQLLVFEVNIPAIKVKDQFFFGSFKLEHRIQNIWQPPKLA